ncbi:hypothetical protein [Staphylococcus intermedius]|uniref:Uncharacterized protein n=1 Tax=Staphylococcus intermedius NCTC 11048 TaxID=1141106 RepID=A0A380G281_STAIN|nr:hypothetical protein [Staphylococcus intermedius]PCF62479.1 hypothetical protein B5C04_11810 [Staphylococcus intermedius]PCF77834.1 hypothetical protein B4W74_12170 [Staphylococcus intermedius]PCF78207.1 hypothetical protein B4W70_11810 [Staphylococcus intermedius]PCF86147.1 hypothetical protein B4W76_07810 [Staphylococcus intermedius]PCF89265.1 hypothetical protein B4W75_00055 [Staphylococcus intermedius]
MKVKKLSKFIISVLSFVLVFSFLMSAPINAKELEAPTKKEIEKAKQFAEKSLKINTDGTYKIDKKSALKIYSESEIKNIDKTFQSIDKKVLAGLNKKYGSPQNKNQQDVTPYFAPAIPIVAMGIWELLGWLGAIGAGAIATAFAQDMYRYGVKSACKKFAEKNKHIKSWCEANGHL